MNGVICFRPNECGERSTSQSSRLCNRNAVTNQRRVQKGKRGQRLRVEVQTSLPCVYERDDYGAVAQA
jgi:hypothetical protein